MTTTVIVWIIIAYLLVLVFASHFIRTLAFGRHEAITFEASSVASVISMLLIYRYGASIHLVLLFVVSIIMFFLNAYTQWYFYVKLQENMEKAFDKRDVVLKEQNSHNYSANEDLRIMASVAIMPSFSRFIEDSKLFNNPGNIIGLTKSIMQRTRFQKKKYQMREKIAECSNLIGPCKSSIDANSKKNKETIDKSPLVPEAIHANELALDNNDEKKGLITFDIMGYGALVLLLVVLIQIYSADTTYDINKSASFLIYISILFIAFISHVLRHFAFARYESISYEVTFISLTAMSFFFIDVFLRSHTIPVFESIMFGLSFLTFIVLSVVNRKADKQVHNDINKKLDNEIISKIEINTELNRIRRRILENLKLICDWAIVPFPGNRKYSKYIARIIHNKDLSKFEEINEKKQDMPSIMAGFVKEIAPEIESEIKPEDFILKDRYKKHMKQISYMLCLLSTCLLVAYMAIKIGKLKSSSVFVLLAVVVIMIFIKRYAEICNAYIDNGIEVFCIPDISKGFVPQGIAYDENSKNVIVTGYMLFGKASPIYVVNMDDTTSIKKLTMLDEKGKEIKGHAGGVSVCDNELFVAGSTDSCMYVFSLEEMYACKSIDRVTAKKRIDMKTADDYIRVSFTSVGDKLLYAGEFHKAPIFYTSKSHSYIKDNLKQNAYILGFEVYDEGQPVPKCVYSIPDSIQGACFYKDKIFLSQSRGFRSSRIMSFTVNNDDNESAEKRKVLGTEVPVYVLDENKADKIVQVPPMSEELIVINDRLYILYESASNLYLIGKLFGMDWVYSTPVTNFY